jgi:hypothetical protein
VTGADSGSVAGIGFSGFGALVGAAGNEDLFVLAPGGSFSGLLDGGAGGFDSLVVEGARGVIGSRATSPRSGSLVIDGIELRYDGLEPITLNGTEIHVTGTDGDDEIRLRPDRQQPVDGVPHRHRRHQDRRHRR